MIFALAGNQNCGKTTLFNQLTGSNQHVGNFPGVTVDQKSGPVRGQKDCTVVDLPGIYSLRPYTAEEIVTRNFILEQKPDCIINIVDATNLERNLLYSSDKTSRRPTNSSQISFSLFEPFFSPEIPFCANVSSNRPRLSIFIESDAGDLFINCASLRISWFRELIFAKGI